MKLRALFVLGALFAFQTAEADSPKCAPHDCKVKWKLQALPDMIPVVSAQVAERTAVPIEQSQPNQFTDLGYAVEGETVTFRGAVWDQDNHVCQGKVVGQVDNLVHADPAISGAANVEGGGNVGTVAFKPGQMAGSWHGSWPVTADQVGKRLQFLLSGTVNDVHCSAHPNADDPASVSLGNYRASVAVPKAEIVTTPGIEIEQGEAYDMAGVLWPSELVKKWKISEYFTQEQIHPDTGRITFKLETKDAPISGWLGGVVTLYARDYPACCDIYDVTFIPFSRPGATAHTGGPLATFSGAMAGSSEDDHFIKVREDSLSQEGDMGFVYASDDDRCQGRQKYVHKIRISGRGFIRVGALFVDQLAIARAGIGLYGKCDNDYPVPIQGKAVELAQVSIPISIPIGPKGSVSPSFNIGRYASMNVDQDAVLRQSVLQPHAATDIVEDRRSINIASGYHLETAATGWAVAAVLVRADHHTPPADIITWKPRIPVP